MNNFLVGYESKFLSLRNLLLKFTKILGKDNVRQGFFGQGMNLSTYNVSRINMVLDNID